jgi:hypothetical protein
VFLLGKFNPAVDYSLNWKSLTQPAILPLTTDFVPSIRMMDSSYDVNSSYQLLVQKNESPFATAEDLMKELICLRLTQVRGMLILPPPCSLLQQALGCSVLLT